MKVADEMFDRCEPLAGNSCFECIPKNSPARNGIDESALETKELLRDVFMKKCLCGSCDYYHPQNNTCQAKKCSTNGCGYVTLFDMMFCKYRRKTNNKFMDSFDFLEVVS